MALFAALWLFALFSSFLPGLCKVIVEKRLFEKREILPFDWLESHEPNPDLVLTVRIGLKQNNIGRLEEFLTSVSHPDSSQYGQHWSPEQVAKTFAPTLDTIKAVKSWLVSSGITGERLGLTPSRGWIYFNATVEEAEELLDAEYKVYRHGSGVEHIGKLNHHP